MVQRLSCAVAVAAFVSLALAGCSSGGSDGGGAQGAFVLAVADSLSGGRLDLKGAYLHRNTTASAAAWVPAVDNGTRMSFTGAGTNVSVSGHVPTGAYDGVRILFAALTVDNRTAVLAQSGVELAVNLTVAAGGTTELRLTFAWADALFESKDGLAFEPALSRLVVVEDGKETQRLEAQAIRTSSQPPVARMRIFDATGLEAFASTFVAESPDKPAVANAGELVLSATGSEALRRGARLTAYSWDVDGTTLSGATVRHTTGVSGGNMTVRLTVTDSDGSTDSQTVKLAVKPGRAERSFNFTGSVTGFTAPGAGTQGSAEHPFGPVNATDLDGVPAKLVHIVATLEPGASGLPVSDLDFSILDGAGAEVASASSSGSQERIDADIAAPPGDGTWTVVVQPQQAYDAAYVVVVTLTWQGVNPEMDAFLATYNDGHSHQH